MIKFYEVMCGQDGIQPDPMKISALKQVPPPTNHKELQTFLGDSKLLGSNYCKPILRTLTALGCKKFYTYLYSQSSTVYTDHKPLESIYLKQRLPPNSGRLGKESRIRVSYGDHFLVRSWASSSTILDLFFRKIRAQVQDSWRG